MTKRRYGDEEVREIFSLATMGTRERSLPAESGGLTLDELQRIGQEAASSRPSVANGSASARSRRTLSLSTCLGSCWAECQ